MDIFEFSCFVILFGIISRPLASQTKQYRRDYTYNKKTNAFYKFHSEEKRGWRANEICKTEGANLLVPTSQNDVAQAHGMFKKYPDLGKYLWIGSDGKSHDSAEEHPLIDLSPQTRSSEFFGSVEGCNAMDRDGIIKSYQCFAELPFICKVEADNAPYDNNCEVYGENYIYYESVGSCYKIPKIVFSWNQAYVECQAETAHLVVLNSVAEHDVVKNLTNSVPKVLGAKTSWFFFAGFRAERPTGNATRIFKTIFNQTLEEAGYATWSPNEPNNYLDSEYCGTIFKNDGNFNDVDCSHEYAFICEKERGS